MHLVGFIIRIKHTKSCSSIWLNYLTYACVHIWRMSIEQKSPLALTRRDSSGCSNEFDQHQKIIIMKIVPVACNTPTGIHRLQLHVCSDTQVPLHNLKECSETLKTPLHPIFTFTPILIFYSQVIYKKYYLSTWFSESLWVKWFAF